MNAIQALEKEIDSFEDLIENAERYLRGEEADLSPFRPLFQLKYDEEGKELPPNKDWVKNSYLKDVRRQLSEAKNSLRNARSRERHRKDGC